MIPTQDSGVRSIYTQVDREHLARKNTAMRSLCNERNRRIKAQFIIRTSQIALCKKCDVPAQTVHSAKLPNNVNLTLICSRMCDPDGIAKKHRCSIAVSRILSRGKRCFTCSRLTSSRVSLGFATALDRERNHKGSAGS